MKRKARLSQQKGFVLVIVLLLLGIIGGLAAAMMSAQQADIQRTERILSQAQAQGLAKGAEIWAKNILQSDIYADKTQSLAWPKIMPPAQRRQMEITAQLWDAQGKFYNINNLSSADYAAGFNYFMRQRMPEAELEKINRFTQDIIYGISANTENNDILTDSYYLNLPVPYHVSRRLMVMPEELENIRSFDKKIYNAILPYLTALPEITPVNLNTAAEEILASLGQGTPVDKAQDLIQQRNLSGGFESGNIAALLTNLKQYQIPNAQITLQSQYFLLEVQIKTTLRTYKFAALFYRSNALDAQGRFSVKMLWEKQN